MGKKSKIKDADADFRVDAADLPDAIDEAALGSGHFPYDKKLKNEPYQTELRGLQIELLKALAWVKKGERVAIVFEGRDGAGKGGTIARLTEHLNPRSVRVVALAKPSEREAGEWYFQRYVSEMPAKGEIVIFDRSWYNRAGVEPVFGFCTPEQTEQFLEEAPRLEAMLARDGIRLIKIFLTIGREMQMKRLHARWHDPLNRWKLSDIDFQAISKFDSYSDAFETMLSRTDIPEAPWTVVRGNDKRRERLEAIRHILDVLPYNDKDHDAVGKPDRSIALSATDFLQAGGERD